MNDPAPIHPFAADFRRLSEQIENMSVLNGSGGDGTSGRMEARIAKLESDMEFVKRDVGELRTDMRATRDAVATLNTATGVLTAKVDTLPTKDWIGQHFRNWILGVGAVLSFITVLSRFIGH